jgi:DNA-binding transcriptional MerR regulator
MRISELSAASRVTVPTLKFYLREGILPPGDPVARNQATYDERHVRRLRLIRALTDVGRLSLREVRDVLRAADDPRVPVHELLGIAQYSLEPSVTAAVDPDARAIVDAAIDALDWRVSADAPARRSIAHAVGVLRSFGWSVEPADLVRYARAVDELAAREVSISDEAVDRERLVERMVVGSVAYEAILGAFRRLAQEHHSAIRNQDPAVRRPRRSSP